MATLTPVVDLASTEQAEALTIADRRRMRHFGAFFGIVLGGIPFLFGAPAIAGVVLTIAAVPLGMTLASWLGWFWEAKEGKWWLEIFLTALVIFGARGWLFILTGWPVKMDSLLIQVLINAPLYHFGRKLKLRASEKKPRPSRSKDR